MMNIITGTFVQSAMQGAEKEKQKDFLESAQNMFTEVDPMDVAIVTRDQYDDMLEDPGFQHQLRLIGVSDMDARLLFRLLDQEGSGEVEFQKLIANMIRMHQGSKFMDIMKLMYVVEGQKRKFEGLTEQVQKTQMEVEETHLAVVEAIVVEAGVRGTVRHNDSNSNMVHRSTSNVVRSHDKNSYRDPNSRASHPDSFFQDRSSQQSNQSPVSPRTASAHVSRPGSVLSDPTMHTMVTEVWEV
jgi:hypothetical protein